jgi:hypothetical protein
MDISCISCWTLRKLSKISCCISRFSVVSLMLSVYQDPFSLLGFLVQVPRPTADGYPSITTQRHRSTSGRAPELSYAHLCDRDIYHSARDATSGFVITCDSRDTYGCWLVLSIRPHSLPPTLRTAVAPMSAAAAAAPPTVADARVIGQLSGHSDSVLCCEVSTSQNCLASGGEVRSFPPPTSSTQPKKIEEHVQATSYMNSSSCLKDAYAI